VQWLGDDGDDASHDERAVDPLRWLRVSEARQACFVKRRGATALDALVRAG
jgi:hypothetical protein